MPHFSSSKFNVFPREYPFFLPLIVQCTENISQKRIEEEKEDEMGQSLSPIHTVGRVRPPPVKKIPAVI